MSAPTAFEAPDVELRQPTGFSNYGGNQVAYFSAAIASRKPSGPLGWPVVAVYDKKAGHTRVGFSLVPPPGVYGDWEQIKRRMPRRTSERSAS